MQAFTTLADIEHLERNVRALVAPHRSPYALIRAAALRFPAREALTFLPEVAVNERQAVSIGYGQQIGADPAIPEGEPLRLVNEGNLIAVAHRDGKIFSYDVVLEPQG